MRHLRLTFLTAALGCTAVFSCSEHHSSLVISDASTEPSTVVPTSNVDASLDASATPAALTPVVVTGPIDGGKGEPFSTSPPAISKIAEHGYSEKEFFFEGQATSYIVPGGMTTDGKWKLEVAKSAPFKTRMLVRHPIDQSKFNGTVIVEWLNVSGGVDSDPGFMYNSDLLLREGFAHIGVSAQAQGVQGGGFSLGSLSGSLGGAMIRPLKTYDPERYGSLQHPGDAYSYNIFSIAGRIVREPGQLDVLDGLKPARLIAYGESQSAGRMVSYVNGEHPIAKVYDAFFIHSRGAGGSGFDDSALGLPISFGGPPNQIRDDLDAKVFQFQTETDVTGMLAFLPARQPDSGKIRTWEVAGTSHADQFLIDYNKKNPSGSVNCPNANAGPQFRVIRAALRSLDVWVRDGTEPPHGDLLTADASGKSVRDANGNALGGVRSPSVDVPISTLSGDSSNSDLLCVIFGSTTPFTPEKLTTLYPTHDDYVAKVTQSAAAARTAGFLLDPEVTAFVDDAKKAPVPQ